MRERRLSSSSSFKKHTHPHAQERKSIFIVIKMCVEEKERDALGRPWSISQEKEREEEDFLLLGTWLVYCLRASFSLCVCLSISNGGPYVRLVQDWREALSRKKDKRKKKPPSWSPLSLTVWDFWRIKIAWKLRTSGPCGLPPFAGPLGPPHSLKKWPQSVGE